MAESMRVGKQTTLADVKAFIDKNAGDKSMVLAKKVLGKTVLYVSDRNKAGKFDFLFGSPRERRDLAKTTITNLVKKASITFMTPINTARPTRRTLPVSQRISCPRSRTCHKTSRCAQGWCQRSAN
jgi:hypothetical protein